MTRWQGLGFGLGLVLFGLLLIFLGSVLVPFLTAALLAFICDPLVNYLEGRGLSRTLSVLLVFSVVLLLLLSVLALLIPLLEAQVNVLIAQIPHLLDWLQSSLLPWLQQYLGIGDSIQLQSVKKAFVTYWHQASSLATNLLISLSSSGMAMLAFLTHLVLIPVVTFYLLRDWQKLLQSLRDLLPRALEPKVVSLAKSCHSVLGAFFCGQLMVMLALGCIYSLGLWMGGLKLALLVGMIAGLMSIVPYLGFIVGILVASIASLMQYHDIQQLWVVGLVFCVGQGIESFLLTPCLIGESIGLHPVAVIFAILAGGQLFGLVGVLLALPVAAVIMVLLRDLHTHYIKSTLYEEIRHD